MSSKKSTDISSTTSNSSEDEDLERYFFNKHEWKNHRKISTNDQFASSNQAAIKVSFSVLINR
jgi:hypothetical protein